MCQTLELYEDTNPSRGKRQRQLVKKPCGRRRSSCTTRWTSPCALQNGKKHCPTPSPSIITGRHRAMWITSTLRRNWATASGRPSREKQSTFDCGTFLVQTQCGPLRVGAARHDVPELLDPVDNADTTEEKMDCLSANSQAQPAGVAKDVTMDDVVPRDHVPEVPVGLGRCVVSHIQERYGTDLVSMGLARKIGQVSECCDEEAGDWKHIQTCDQLSQRTCALNPRWLHYQSHSPSSHI